MGKRGGGGGGESRIIEHIASKDGTPSASGGGFMKLLMYFPYLVIITSPWRKDWLFICTKLDAPYIPIQMLGGKFG